MRARVADKKKSAKVRVAHKAVDHGVAPEHNLGREAYPKKNTVDLVKKQVEKRYKLLSLIEAD